MTGFIAPNPRWSARNLVGDAAIGASLYTYQAGTDIPKTTYQDPALQFPNTNPIILDSKGEANIYWNSDNLYRIVLVGVNGKIIYTQDNYPVVNSNGDNIITIYQNKINLVRNPQFTYWNNGTVFTNIGTFNNIAADWYLNRSNTSATIIVSRQEFLLGQSTVPDNPLYYVNYECTDIGAGGELAKNLTQRNKNVQTLSGQQIAVSFYAKSQTSSTISVDILQSFGGGGTPSTPVLTNITVVNLTTEWTQYTGFVTLPSVEGKVIGTNLDDYTALNFGMPLNAIASVDIANVQMQLGDVVPEFIYSTPDQQFNSSKSLVNQAVFTTGDFVLSLRNDSREGWVLCEDQTIGAYNSGASYALTDCQALFILLWNNVSNTYAPLLDSSGNPVARGVSAIADFNAARRLTLTRALGRALASAGAGVGLTSRALGEFLGEETNALVKANIPPHTHEYSRATTLISMARNDSPALTALETTNTGDGSSDGLAGTPHNNMQPTIFVNVYIKL